MPRSRLILVAVATAVILAAVGVLGASSSRSNAATTRGTVAYSFISWGDMRPGSSALHATYTAGWRHVRDKMATTSHAFEIVEGDMVNVTGSDSVATVNGKYADLFTAMGAIRSIPKSYVIGNHEDVGASAAARAGWETNIHASHYGVYTYDAGTVASPRIRVINLSTYEAGHLGNIGYYGETSTSNSTQGKWLVSTLRAHAWDPNTYIVVSLHHPFADTKPGEGNTSERNALETLFGKYGVDMVLAGHVHQYLRHMMPDGTPYIIQGMAGADPKDEAYSVHHAPGTDAVRVGSADSTHKQYGFTRFQATTDGHLFADTFVTIESTWAWRIADTFEVKQKAPTVAAPTPAPTITPAPTSFQPTAPYYATFLYPWYRSVVVDGSYSYWQDHSNTPPRTWFSHFLPNPDTTQFNPKTELYSSLNYGTFKWQAAKMAEARQEVAIISWFGQGSKQDVALSTYLRDFMKRSDNPYPNLRFALYYEDEGFSDPTVSQLVNDLTYIKAKYAGSPYFLKVKGKPVVFVYAGANDASGMAKRWHDANAQMGNAFYYVLKVYGGYAGDPNQPSSWHQYSPASRYNSYGGYSCYVSPGFWWDAPGQAVRLPRDLTAFGGAVTRMVNSGTTWRLVETWNEWGEGSSVEPGHQTMIDPAGREVFNPNGAPFANRYVRALADRLPALEQGTGK